MSKKTALIILAVVFGIVAIGFGANTISTNLSSPPGDNKEAEKGGPATVAILDTAKLSALLTPARFSAAKTMLSDFVLAASKGTKSASLDDTQLNSDGSIAVSATTDNDKAFTAIIHNLPDRLVLDVPSANYEKVLTDEQIISSYGGSVD